MRPDLLDRETRPKALVVLNPVAGNSDASIVRQALEENLGNGDWYYEIYETTGQERLADVVRAALGQDFDVFVAAGGDGTVSGVVNGLIHSKHPLGIIPVGTGNTLARELDIPLNIEDALGILIGEHEVRTIDVQTGASSSLPVNHCQYKEMVSSSDIRPCKWTSCPALCR